MSTPAAAPRRAWVRLVCCLLCLLPGACALAPAQAPMAPAPAVPAANAPASGSIYQASTSLALFEDQKARRVGDVLTILLVERTAAEKSASTSASKDSTTGIASPTLFGRPVTYHGLPILGAELESTRDFEGGGESTQSNRLSGSVSVLVTQVLPNGNLVVRGEKQLELNQGSETVSIEGIVRPADILASNSVTSDRVANARITYGGSGPVADANVVGWLSRFFMSALWPF